MKADAFRDQVVMVTGASSCIGRGLDLLEVNVVLPVRHTDLLIWKDSRC